MVQEIQVEGTLRRLEPGTRWGCGCHLIEQDGFLYALTSDRQDLTRYEDSDVRLSGRIEQIRRSDTDDPTCLNVTEVRPV